MHVTGMRLARSLALALTVALWAAATAAHPDDESSLRPCVDPPPVAAPAPPLPSPPPSPIRTIEDAKRLKLKIAKAKKALDNKWVGTWRRGGAHAVLAVSDLADGPIKIVYVRNGVSRTKGFTVSLKKKNGVNSHYDVLEPTGLAVLAMKTNASVSRDGRKRRTEPVIYVPYSPALDSPGMRELGMAHLQKTVDDAAAKLDGRKVTSRTEEDSLVTEVSPVRAMITILLIEHMDHDEYFAEGPGTSVNKVLTTIGLNDERSYDYAFSHAGAGGLAQFIRKTYDATRRAYPLARLHPGFYAGMRNHVNAVMAQFCLVDMELSVLPPELYVRWNQHDEKLGLYIASSYNGGSSRTLMAIADHPDDWTEAGNGLFPETVIYLKKFREVYAHLYP